jgi:phosphonatase-like hydrolase
MTVPALVVLDMAGTTIEDRGQVPAAFAGTLAANGLIVSPDDITRVRGASKRQAIASLVGGSGAKADRIYGEFRSTLAHAYTTGGVRSVPGADAVLSELRARGIKVALTTGFDRDIAMLLLTSVGWQNNTIDALVCGDDVANGRPAPDMILLSMKLTGVADPAEVANAGDTTLDLESAARAGVKWNIGVLSGAHQREALERAPHTHILESIAELPGILGR